ncbi:MAG: UvrD-helicase domain-containing protein, partial [Chloroflexi bacterium]|nr:UvrD-helicase domain-containing protein [Chloroflexota bacterium]
YQSRFRHVLVDEFQDTNVAQYVLTKQLAGKHRNICVVGDPDQSIYTWRQADIRNILKFEEDYPGAKVVVLEQNYRSTQTILAAADKVIAHNEQRKKKTLWTENEKGTPITLVEAADEQEEAQFVVAEVERLLKEHSIARKEIVVLYRVNAQSRALEEAFLRFGVPYRLVGGTRFYQRREVKDAIAYLRLAHNPQDTVSLRRIINVPQRGIGQRTVEELLNEAKDKKVSVYDAMSMAGSNAEISLSPRIRKPLADFYALIEELVEKNKQLKAGEMLELVIQKTGYERHLLAEEDGEDRWENIKELLTVARKQDDLSPGESLATFLEEVSLVSDIDSYDEKADVVTLTTLHQAKGLEFAAVFIVGMEEKIFPHSRTLPPLAEPSEMEEERRLCYVGITRAKKRLYLVRASRRTYLGSTNINAPSRFLAEIPGELVKNSGPRPQSRTTWTATPPWKPLPASLAGNGAPAPPVKLDVQPGDRVRHDRFGDGTVVSTTPLANDYQVTVAFPSAGVKKLILSYARLEKIG